MPRVPELLLDLIRKPQSTVSKSQTPRTSALEVINSLIRSELRWVLTNFTKGVDLHRLHWSLILSTEVILEGSE